MSTEDIQFNESDFSSFADQLSLGQDGSTASPPEAPSPAAGAPASPPAPSASSPVLPDPYATPPSSWAKEYHTKWGGLDPDARKYIHQREEQMLSGIRQYAKAGEFGSKVQKVIEPFRELLETNGVDPVQAFESLFRAHVALTHGDDETKRNWANYIAQNYGLQQLLGAAQVQGPDPMLGQLQQQVQSLQQTIFNDQKQKIFNEIKAFASDPANEYFNDLYDDIVKEIQSGRAANIAQAYENAKWLNAGVRAKIIAKETATAPNTPAPAAQTKPLRSSGEPVSPAAAAAKSIDDTLEEAYSRLS